MRLLYAKPVSSLVLVALLALSICSQALTITYCSPELVGEPNRTNSIYMSNGFCQNLCQNNAVFAVILGTDCWCSDLAPATQLETSLCNTPCPGYPPDTCGSTTQNLYAYFNLGQRPSGTGVALTAISIAATQPASITSDLATSDPLTQTTFSTETSGTSNQQSTSSAAAAATSTNSARGSSFTNTDASDIALYIQTAIPSSDRTQSSNACFLNSAYSYYSTPTWYQEFPTQVQSYYSSSAQGATAACTLSAAQVNTTSQRSSGLSTGAKAGIAVGVILAVLIVAALIFFCVKRRNRRRRHAQAIENGKADLEREKAAIPAAGYVHTDEHHYPTARSSDEDFTALPSPPPSAHMQATHPAYLGAARGLHKDSSIQSTPSPSSSETSYIGQPPAKPWVNYANQRARSEMSEDQQFFPALQQQNPYQLDPELDFAGNNQRHNVPGRPTGAVTGQQVVHPGGTAGGYGHFSGDTGGYESGGERSWYHAR